MPADHLDDDVISDAIDGVDPPAPAAEHLASCPPCQARLARFAEASRLVAAPVRPLEASAVDALVERALAAPVVPIDDLREQRQRRRLQRAAPPPWVVAVAAALALVVGLPALLRVTGTSTNTDSAMVRDGGNAALSEGASSRAAGSGASGGGSGSANSTLGDHLGALDSDAAVVASLRSRLDVVESPQLLAEPTGDADDAAASQPAETTAVARAAQSKASPRHSTFANDAAGPSVPACQDEAKAAARGTSAGGEPIYYAPATWQGRAVMVFVFTLAQPADDGLRRQAYVMAVPGCAVVAFPRL